MPVRLAARLHLLRLTQLGLELLALGQVADDAGEQPPPGRQPGFADGELEGELAASLAAASNLATDADDARLAGLEIALQELVMIDGLRVRHEQAHIAPDHLALRVAEDARGGRIEGLHDTILVDGDDAVGGGIEHGAYVAFALAQVVERLDARDRQSQGIGHLR